MWDFIFSWCPKQESDLRLVLTKDVFYHETIRAIKLVLLYGHTDKNQGQKHPIMTMPRLFGLASEMFPEQPMQ